MANACPGTNGLQVARVIEDHKVGVVDWSDATQWLASQPMTWCDSWSLRAALAALADLSDATQWLVSQQTTAGRYGLPWRPWQSVTRLAESHS